MIGYHQLSDGVPLKGLNKVEDFNLLWITYCHSVSQKMLRKWLEALSKRKLLVVLIFHQGQVPPSSDVFTPDRAQFNETWTT